MKIKEVCEKTLLTERTVRFYMQKGLICPKNEWVNGRYYTDFSDEDVDILKSIALLRQMTFSIEEILKMINEPALISQIVNNKRAEAKNSFDEARNAYELLDLIDTEGIDSMMALAKELKLAVKDRPLIKSEPPQEINESGMGDRCQSMPKGLKDRWNLGAFLFPVIWGLANHVYQALLCLIPVFGIFYAFYLGKNGNELAWRGRYWESAEVFKKTQRIWALVTAIAAAFQISLAAGVFIMDSAAKKQHEADIDSLKNQLTLSEEFKSIAGERTEWTDDMGISYADPQEYPEDTKSLDMAIEECINTTIYILSDPFYKEADKYYRVLASDSFDFDFYMDDESMTDAFTDEEAADSSFRYTAVVEFSSAEAWTFSCRVNKDNKLTAVFSEPMEGYDPMMHLSRDTLEKAADHVREYLKTRYAEVTSSPLFKETVGDSFLVVQINPQVTNTFLVYEGQNPECKGLYLVVKTDDGKEYAAVIDVEYDEKTDTEKERKLYILEQP